MYPQCVVLCAIATRVFPSCWSVHYGKAPLPSTILVEDYRRGCIQSNRAVGFTLAVTAWSQNSHRRPSVHLLLHVVTCRRGASIFGQCPAALKDQDPPQGWQTPHLKGLRKLACRRLGHLVIVSLSSVRDDGVTFSGLLAAHGI